MFGPEYGRAVMGGLYLAAAVIAIVMLAIGVFLGWAFL